MNRSKRRRSYVTPTIQRTAGQVQFPIRHRPGSFKGLLTRYEPARAPTSGKRCPLAWAFIAIVLTIIVSAHLYFVSAEPDATDAMMREWAALFDDGESAAKE